MGRGVGVVQREAQSGEARQTIRIVDPQPDPVIILGRGAGWYELRIIIDPRYPAKAWGPYAYKHRWVAKENDKWICKTDYLGKLTDEQMARYHRGLSPREVVTGRAADAETAA